MAEPRSEPLSTNGKNWGAKMSLPRSVFQKYSMSTRTSQEVIKEPRTTSKQVQASLASVKVRVHGLIRKRLSNNKNHCRPKRTQKLVSHLTRSVKRHDPQGL